MDTKDSRAGNVNAPREDFQKKFDILDKKLQEEDVQKQLDSMTLEELLSLKKFLFEERIRVMQEKE